MEIGKRGHCERSFIASRKHLGGPNKVRPGTHDAYSGSGLTPRVAWAVLWEVFKGAQQEDERWATGPAQVLSRGWSAGNRFEAMRPYLMLQRTSQWRSTRRLPARLQTRAALRRTGNKRSGYAARASAPTFATAPS